MSFGTAHLQPLDAPLYCTNTLETLFHSTMSNAMLTKDQDISEPKFLVIALPSKVFRSQLPCSPIDNAEDACAVEVSISYTISNNVLRGYLIHV